MPISELVATVAQVRCLKQGNEQASASGFFYLHANRLYFITNRHVVVKEDNNYFPDELHLRLHTNPNNIRENDILSVPLYKNEGTPLWLEHPTGRKEIDVVAVPLETDQVKARFFIKAFDISNHIPQDVEISIGEDIIVIGYPLGFHDIMHNLPIVRNATMASVYPVPFEGRPIILIDSRLHSGTSGSPVLTKPTNIIHKTDGRTTMIGGPVSHLVGVHSATFDIKDRDPKRDEPLGLSVVWFASLFPQIIEGRA